MTKASERERVRREGAVVMASVRESGESPRAAWGCDDGPAGGYDKGARETGTAMAAGDAHGGRTAVLEVPAEWGFGEQVNAHTFADL